MNAQKTTKRQPRLDTVLMIEQAVEDTNGECGKFQLWRRLPTSTMYQTYLAVLDYLEHSNKIAYDKNGKVVWIFSPKAFKRYEQGPTR